MVDSNPMMLLSDGTASPQAMAEQLMAGMAEGKPHLSLLTQLMQARANTVAEAEAEEDAVVLALREQLAATEDQLERVRHKAKRLLNAHRAAIERLSDLAAALGACGLCWGEDDHCPGCHGRGRPGMVRPDPGSRERLLGPPRRNERAAEQTGAERH